MKQATKKKSNENWGNKEDEKRIKDQNLIYVGVKLSFPRHIYIGECTKHGISNKKLS